MEGSESGFGTKKSSGSAATDVKNISIGLAALLLVGWNSYKPVIAWWDRKGFETVVEKTLAQRGIATPSDSPTFEVAEHGMGDFKGRKLQAVVIRTELEQVDKAAGTKTERCILMFSLIDKEFDVYRNMSLADCSEQRDLDSWKAAVKYR